MAFSKFNICQGDEEMVGGIECVSHSLLTVPLLKTDFPIQSFFPTIAPHPEMACLPEFPDNSPCQVYSMWIGLKTLQVLCINQCVSHPQ